MSTTLAAPPLRRVSYSFSLDGGHAACLATVGDGTWHVESWPLVPGASGAAPVPERPNGGRAEHLHTQLLALSDGSVLLCRHEPGGRHDLVLVGGPDADGEQVVASVRSPGLRLLPYPGADGLALALGTDTTPTTTVWRVPIGGGPLETFAELPGMFGGGVWLDTEARRLALDAVRGGRVKSAVLDLSEGVLSPLLELAEDSNDRLQLCDPVSGLLVISSDAPGHERLGWIRLPEDRGESPERVRFPEMVHLPNTTVRPVAIAPDGARVALQLDRGATSRLAVWGPEDGTLLDVAVPEGCLGGVGRWTSTGLHIPFSTPDRPGALATVLPDRPGRWQLAGNNGGVPQARVASAGFAGFTADAEQSEATAQAEPDGDAAPVWHPAHLELLVGEVGPVESVVYGGLDWRTAEHVVLALHGGPAAAWRFEFSPVLQHLAAHGIAVVAPNQRGSIGYGESYASCLHGAWGGPDLEDIAAIARTLGGERVAAGLPLPSLFGTSYGAYLALLAACTEPDAWSGVLAVAPFLSGPRLIAEASLPVRALMTRLGGDVELDDALGPRDVLRLCEGLRAPLLVVHGDRDDVIPVGQSRTLRHRLLQLGRAEGGDFRYLELPGQGHEVFAGDGAPELYTRLTAFLRSYEV
ncbi:alpha/beta hydrolase family protein [Yinghuangia seranimata]|uniref:alpha/beta hydrolase family protein n=1 Tax=Yinghuangia seranimata TaxID=408067 RepID=UPI00248A953E|nr:alpha/beta fold hydrolase [Yinghuangia seranimata]MDI2128584.1 alpha/beta fold hydrolase [Yinghuangia seranimata]